MSDWYVPAPASHIKKEKEKARELRKSSWWKQQVGRGICYYCEKKFLPAELTMEHILPIARGGTSSKKNCVPCCKDCNSKKGAKTKVELALEELKASKKSKNEED